ncbi:FGGY-family carbohydrate kinase [Saxibacter everestensis]|uniref:FGGY-family carbohydrate kinase n=1 Tax=Saxibacter everestensis TaxID=2909229 RepID=A0ABY8QQP8_9MICO|nr:FGGY-family carbohydrate kinase [Brevibacteriaceae bacterium ZFBP1038]
MFLGIDIGTGSSKAVLVDRDGEIIDSAVVAHAVSLPKPGWAEFDAEEVWWAEVGLLSRELFSRNDAVDVAGVCVSGVGPALVVTDENHTPLRPAILYGIDTRAGAEIDELNHEIGEEVIFAECGKALSSQAVGPKLRWISNHEPEVFEKTARWFGCSSFIVAKLSGAYVQDHHTASQCDPLYDIRAGEWNEPRVKEIAGHIPMPRLAWSSDVVGEVTAQAAEFTGIPQGTPVCAGTVDAWAESFSAGIRKPGDLMLMYGSTLFFVLMLSEFRASDKLWTTAGIEKDSLTLAAGMSTSGSLTTWMQQLFGGVEFAELLAEAGEVPAGSEGLLVLPYFAGERSPIFDPDARGVIAGLTLRHSRGHLFRATYEGIAFGIRQIIDFLEAGGEPIERLVAVGGGTQARLWTQIVSDVTGRPQMVPTQTIGASYGDALLAAIGTGAVPPDTNWATDGTLIEPDQRNKEIYAELYGHYESLYPSTREHMHALARVQGRPKIQDSPEA